MSDSVSSNRKKSFHALRALLEALHGSHPRDIDEALSELSRLESQAGHAEEQRLEALYQVSRTLGSSLNMDDVLRETMDAVIHLTGAERGFLMLIEPETGELELRAARNIQRENLDQEDMQVSRSIIQEVIRSRSGVITTNAQTDARFSDRESIQHYALRSILCVPLFLRDEATGVIYVDNRIKTGAFQPGDRELLEAFAAQAAVALENARLYTQVDTQLAARVAELEIFERIDRELNTGLDYERVLDLTLEWALRSTDSEAGWIALITEPGEPASIVAGAGHGTMLDLDQAPWKGAILEGKPARSETPGETLPFLLVAPVRREGQISALIGVRRAGTPHTAESEAFLVRLVEHAAVAIENTRLYQAVRQADEYKSQFISIVSHELKIPMTSIRGYADLIRQGAAGEITDQQAKFLHTIIMNVDRMADLVSDLSDISRIDTGRLRVTLEPLPLAELVRNTAAAMRPQFEAKAQALHLELEAGLPMVVADHNRLVQVMTNLLSNANKYTPEGGEITIQAAAEKGRIRLSVEDTGIGLSKDDQAKLFGQFFRSEEPEVREQAGWGLGLYVTRRLLELMGGSIGMKSELGAGTTFWVLLPASTGMDA